MSDVRKEIRRLYRDVDGFEIPKAEEKAVRASRGSPIYGELTPAGVARMIDYLDLGPRDVFYDLGSGSGKVVLQTAMTAPVRKAVGVELAATRVAAAKKVLRKARGEGLLVAKACGFRHEDILDTYLADATVIYTCSTAFSVRFLAAVAKRINGLGRPLRFLTLQELVRVPPEFEEAKALRVPTTWTRSCEVAIYHVSGRRKRPI